jgi:hypothetical protein
MMCKTIDAIKKHKHKRAIKFGGIDTCHLGFKGGIGALYMKLNESAGSPLRHLWASAENRISKMRLDSIKRSNTRHPSHPTSDKTKHYHEHDMDGRGGLCNSER